MTPTFTSKKSFRIIGLQFRGNNNNNECPKLWESFSKRSDELIPKALKPVNAYGVCSDFEMEQKIFTYTAGLEVSNDATIPEGMVGLQIPEHEYAVFECTLPVLEKTIDYIYKTWLPKSEYKHSASLEIEYYDKDFDPQKPESIMYLYIPISKE